MKRHHLDTPHTHTHKNLKIPRFLVCLLWLLRCLLTKTHLKIKHQNLQAQANILFKDRMAFPLVCSAWGHQLLLYKWCVVISEGCGKTVEFKDYLPACFSTKLNQIMGSFHGFQIESSRELAGEKRGKKGNCRYEYIQNQNVSFPPQSTPCPLKRARGYLFGLSI